MDLAVHAFAPSGLRLWKPRRAVNAREARARNRRARALLNGPMFLQGADVPVYRHLDARAGVDVASRFPGRGSTLSVVGGQAVARLGDEVASGASVAVQCYPTLVSGGQITQAGDPEHVGRAGLALLPDGRLAFVVGRGSLSAFSRAIVEQLGAVWAGYTDGGTSTALWRGRHLAGSSTRPIPTWLLDVPPAGGATPIVVGAVALGIGLLYAVRSSR